MCLPAVIAGCVAHIFAAAVIVAGVIPYSLTGWRLEQRWTLAMGGGMLVIVGIAVHSAYFWLFVRDGRGTTQWARPLAGDANDSSNTSLRRRR